MDAFLEAAGIKLLQDDSVLIDDSVYIYGRAEFQASGPGNKQKEDSGADHGQPGQLEACHSHSP